LRRRCNRRACSSALDAAPLQQPRRGMGAYTLRVLVRVDCHSSPRSCFFCPCQLSRHPSIHPSHPPKITDASERPKRGPSLLGCAPIFAQGPMAFQIGVPLVSNWYPNVVCSHAAQREMHPPRSVCARCVKANHLCRYGAVGKVDIAFPGLRCSQVRWRKPCLPSSCCA
jgi:hypothetical protein